MLQPYSHPRPRRAALRLDRLEDRSAPAVLALAAVADNTLYEHDTGQLSNGAGEHLYVGRTGVAAGNKLRRSVLKFDVSAIPAGSTINAATLTLHVSRPNNAAQPLAVHRLLADWGEGTSDAGAGGTGLGEGDGTAPAAGDATWVHRFFNAQTWTTPGGDYRATASAIENINAVGSYNWPGLAADVQQWFANPATNFGWILIGNEAAAVTAKELSSRQSATAANRPTLTIDFTPPPPDLTVDKSHVGDFTQGDPAATYSIVVGNVGPGPTTGTVTITDVLPAGLTPTAANAGTINGWNVSAAGQAVTATRSNPLAGGAFYPALTVTVAVAPTAPASLTNTATVSVGGEANTANNSDDDPTNIVQVADLTVDKAHTGDFTQGDTGRGYTIRVRNVGAGPTRAAVTVTDLVPDGLMPTAANTGTINGWNVSVSGQTVTATRNDVLASAASYPDLPLVVDVDFAAPPSVTNTATVSGGGEANTANNRDDDPTTIRAYVAPNRPPVNTLPATFGTTEDAPLTLAGVSVADPDAGSADVRATLTVDSGALSLNTGVPGGVAAGQVAGNGTGTLVVTARQSAINATLASANGLRFTPAAEFNGTVFLVLETDDLGNTGTGGPLTDTDLATIAVSEVNDAPIQTLPAAGSTPADTPLALSGISISDADAGGSPVSVVLNVSAGRLVLSTSVPGGLSAADVSGNDSGLVTVFAPLSAVNATLAAASGLVYTPPANFTGTATLTLVTNDLGSSGPGGAQTDTDTQAITVTRVLDHFTITVPATATAGLPVNVTVTARNAAGSVLTNYSGSVTLATGDPQGTLPASATFTAGVATFPATLRTAGPQTITATDSATHSVSVRGTLVVTPAAATRLAFEQQPTGTLVNAPFLPAVRVVARDAFGNVATGNTDLIRVRLHTSPAGALLAGTTSVRLAGGVATFPTLRVSKAGAGFTLSASAAALPLAVSDPFAVSAVARFAVTASPPTATAGVPLTVTVRALDARGQVVTGYAGRVHFTSSDPRAVLPADGALANGEASFPVTLRTAGPRTVSVADLALPTVRGVTRPVAVAPAAVSALRLSGLPTHAVAGRPQPLTVAAVDPFGNINATYRGTVTLTGTDPAAGLPPAYTFTARDAGKHVFPVTLNTAGLRSISAADGTHTVERANVLVAGPAAAVLAQPDPGDPGQTALVVIGTAGSDFIDVTPTNPAGNQVEVRINGVSQGSVFTPTGHLFAYGLGGNDTIRVQAGTGALAGVRVAIPVVIDGGLGNDTVDASGAAAPAILLGRDGNDGLTGGTGRDVVVGGAGKDAARGGEGDDLLIAGATAFDPDLTGLFAVMAEWSDAGTDFVTRVRHLNGEAAGGANGAAVLTAATVPNDPQPDQLSGEAGRDWFLFTATGRVLDQVLDAADGEVLTGL